MERVAAAQQSRGVGRGRSELLHRLLRHRTVSPRCDGFALPFVVLAVLVMSVGTLAIANRSGLGTLGTVYQRLSFNAQEAAEIGTNRIISELNRPQNRGLLRSKGTTVESTLWTSSEASGPHASRCPDTPAPDLASNPSIGYPSTGSASPYATVYLRDDGSLSSSASGASRAYRLVAVTRRPESELKIFQTMAAPAGTVTLEVEGQALSPTGAITAVTTLRREFQLVPKCCGTSFGGAYGNVDYRRPSSDAIAYGCLPDSMLGLGLVAGTGTGSGSSTGSFSLKGSISVSTDSGQAISTVYCLADASGSCTIRDQSKTTDIDLIDPRPSNVPLALTYPGSTSSPPPAVLSEPSPKTTNPAAFTYCLDSTCKAWAVNADATSLPANCSRTATETHCYLAKLDYKGADLYILTNNRKLRLYFVNPGQIIEGGNSNNGIRHCKTIDSGSPPSCSGTLPSTTDLALFGCNSCGVQTYTWKGTPDVLTAFVYIPNGEATLAGTSNFEGVIWTNKLDSTGNVSWVVPGSGLRDVLELMGLLAPKGEMPSSNPLLFDYVARATSSFRWLNR